MLGLPLTAVFADLTDPRRETANKLHRLTDILAITTRAVIGGAESWEAVAEYGRAKAAFSRRFLKLDNGVPSADTFARVFAKLAPDEFARAFGRCMAAAYQATGLVPVAIDGKSVRRAKRDTATGCLTAVSAWATENRLTLGQSAVADGPNEVAAIPDLIRTLDLAGAIVTIDAAGCQAEDARLIRERGGHYLLAVKGNPPALLAAAERAVEAAAEADFAGVDGGEQTDDAHGRHEERYMGVFRNLEGVPPVWPDVAAVVQVNREREAGGGRTCTSHYYVTSHPGTAAELGAFVRGHWGIEAMHWVLDVVFREDASRVREGHAGANLAKIRRAAVALLRRAPGKSTTPTKRLKAGWDDDYLLKVLNGRSDT